MVVPENKIVDQRGRPKYPDTIMVVKNIVALKIGEGYRINANGCDADKLAHRLRSRIRAWDLQAKFRVLVQPDKASVIIQKKSVK